MSFVGVVDIEISWISCQIRILRVAHATGMLRTFSQPPRFSITEHVVMHDEVANWPFPLKSFAGEKFPAFPAHALPAILRICQEAHAMDRFIQWSLGIIWIMHPDWCRIETYLKPTINICTQYSSIIISNCQCWTNGREECRNSGMITKYIFLDSYMWIGCRVWVTNAKHCKNILARVCLSVSDHNTCVQFSPWTSQRTPHRSPIKAI